jgi:hypothetical protein
MGCSRLDTIENLGVVQEEVGGEAMLLVGVGLAEAVALGQ